MSGELCLVRIFSEGAKGNSVEGIEGEETEGVCVRLVDGKNGLWRGWVYKKGVVISGLFIC